MSLDVTCSLALDDPIKDSGLNSPPFRLDLSNDPDPGTPLNHRLPSSSFCPGNLTSPTWNWALPQGPRQHPRLQNLLTPPQTSPSAALVQLPYRSPRPRECPVAPPTAGAPAPSIPGTSPGLSRSPQRSRPGHLLADPVPFVPPLAPPTNRCLLIPTRALLARRSPDTDAPTQSRAQARLPPAASLSPGPARPPGGLSPGRHSPGIP